jgi:hypothetical protein
MTTPVNSTAYIESGGAKNLYTVIKLDATPTSALTNYPKYQIGVFGSLVYMLTSFSSAGGYLSANWTLIGGVGPNVDTLSDTAGTLVYALNGNIQLKGTTGNLSVTAGTNELTFAAINSGALVWTDKAISFSAASNNGYFVTAVATALLPASPAQGDQIAFISGTASALTITANTGQKIRVGNVLSALAGTAVSTQNGDSIDLVYRAADATWYSWCGPQGIWNVT